MTTTVVTNSQVSGVEVYEDMFKEITRKLYGGEDCLHAPVPSVTGATDLSDRNDFEHGFSNTHTFHQINKQNQTNSSASSSSLLNNLSLSSGNINIPSNGIVPDNNQGSEISPWNNKSEILQYSNRHFKNKNLNLTQPVIGSNCQTLQKRYNCSNCPYSTDRRDLFTRHENIHKEEKPFHCYICLKQFNRADHVKKHFLRMHRGLNYDISRTKRSITQPKSKKLHTPGTAGTAGSSYFNNANTQNSTHNIPTAYHTSLPNHQIEQQLQTSVINQTNQNLTSTYNASSIVGSNRQSQSQSQLSNLKVEKDTEKVAKKGDKCFICCYCSWSGNDNWSLKRHLNTHTKPFVCILCDYKAARSERLATHVLKVHNKKVCIKCNFLAENQNEYNTHLNDAHAHETRSQRSSASVDVKPQTNNILRNTNNSFSGRNSLNSVNEASAGQTFNSWRSILSSSLNGSSNQKRGAERLFQYFEADDSDPEDYARQLQMAALSRNTSSVAQDFHNAGGVKNKRTKYAKKRVIYNSKNESLIRKKVDQLFKLFGTQTNDRLLNIDFHEKNAENTEPVYGSKLRQYIISPPANYKENIDYFVELKNESRFH